MGHHCRGGPAPGTGLLVAVLCRSPQVEPRVAPARADYSAIPRSRSYLPLKQRQHRLALTQLLQLSARCHTVFRNAHAVVFIVVNVSQVQMFIHGTLNKKMLSIALQTRSRLKRADCARTWGNASFTSNQDDMLSPQIRTELETDPKLFSEMENNRTQRDMPEPAIAAHVASD